VAVTVSDLKRSVAWYQEVLGLERRHPEWDVPVFLCAGETGLALFPARSKSPSAAAPSGGVSIVHIAFRADRATFKAAQDELRARSLAFEFEDHGASHSIYFPDPDGHQLEITTYEMG